MSTSACLLVVMLLGVHVLAVACGPRRRPSVVPRQVIDEWGGEVMKELDFKNEASNMMKVGLFCRLAASIPQSPPPPDPTP